MPTTRLHVTRHARERLHERFPHCRNEVVECCRSALDRLAEFVGDAPFRYRHGNLVAVIAGDRLVTVYEQKRGPRWPVQDRIREFMH